MSRKWQITARLAPDMSLIASDGGGIVQVSTSERPAIDDSAILASHPSLTRALRPSRRRIP